MPRRGILVLLVAGAGLVLLALRGAVAYDFERYVVIGGFDASRWTWLLVAAGGALALLGLFVRGDILAPAALANSVAAAIVAIAIVWTARTTPHRVEPASTTVDCRNQNIGFGCRVNQLLDALEPGPPDAAPSRALLIAALGTYALISASLLIRAARGGRSPG